MSKIAIVRAVGFDSDECERLAQELGDVSEKTKFIVTNGETNVLSKEEFAEILQQYAEAAGYDLVEQ